MVLHRLPNDFRVRLGVIGFAVATTLSLACGGSSRGAATPQAAFPTETSSAVVSPSPVASSTLTPDAEAQIRTKVKQLLAAGLRESGLSLNSDDAKRKIGEAPSHMASLSDLDPEYLSRLIDVCDIGLWGLTLTIPGFTIPNKYNGPPEVIADRTVKPDATPRYASALLGSCQGIAGAARDLYAVSGNAKFKEANEDWKPLHLQVFEEVTAKEPRIDKSAWQTIAHVYYDLSFAITPPSGAPNAP